MKLKRIHFLLLLVIGLMVSCSPRGGYKVLSFFFDGVPDSKKKQNSAPGFSTRPNGNVALASIKPVKVAPQYFYHQPFFDKECSKCHDKTSSTGLVLSMPGLCYTCHKDFKDKFKFIHGPVAGGFCNACHLPHRSENKYFLKRQGTNLCLYCHEKEQVMKVGAHSGIGVRDCMECHDPHGGSTRYVLK